MARQVLTNTNLNGFNVARQIPVASPFSDTLSNYASNENYTSIVGNERYYGNFNIGDANPFRSTMLFTLMRVGAEAGANRAFVGVPIIFFGTNSPRNDRARGYSFSIVENLFSSGENFSVTGSMIQTPYGSSADIYSRVERWFSTVGDDPGGNTIYNTNEGTVSQPVTFETTDIIDCYNLRDIDLNYTISVRGINPSRIVNLTSGSLVMIYSAALSTSISTSTADWSGFFNSINTTYYGFNTISGGLDNPAFIDGARRYSTSTAWATLNDTALNVNIAPVWSGAPYQMTLAFIYP